MKSHILPFAILASLIASCGGEQQPNADKPIAPGAGQPPDHGKAADLGTVTVAGKQFGIVRLGDLVPGKEGAFEVHPKGLASGELATLNAYLWVESQDGAQLSAPEKGSPSGSALHFHVTPRKDAKVPFRVVLRLRSGSTDERGSLPLDGHGHDHAEGPHQGVTATFKGGDVTGHLELKLHDDKGDLELWLAEDAAFQKPFDLPLDSTVEIEFVDVGNRKVTLRPRNNDENEGEDGKANVRDGKTNYFIYPSQGEDSAWLQGKTFQSIVVVRFTRSGQPLASEELVLKPHAH
jgi:hypothetical protein